MVRIDEHFSLGKGSVNLTRCVINYLLKVSIKSNLNFT